MQIAGAVTLPDGSNLPGGGGGAAAAAYAATGRSAAPPSTPLAPGDYLPTLVVAKANSGIKDTMQTQVRTAAPDRVQVQLLFSAANGALRARHDTAKNSISNVR